MKSTKHLWKRCISLLLVLCMVGAFILPNIKVNAADTDADLWVDPVNGSDANDGLTEATALKSIQAAKSKAAELSADQDVVVILKSGTYDATETIQFGKADSGKNGHTITYRSASGETAIISGGKRLEGWTLHDANNNIYVTDIPEGAELIRQFYVNGQPQRMASTEVTPTDWAMLSTAGYSSPAVSSPSSNEYLILDLGEDKMISSVVLYAGSDRASDGNAAGFPQDFTISTSADGINWTVQVEETGFVAPIARSGAEFIFSTVGARYIKLDVTKLGNPTRNKPEDYFLALSEVFVGLSGKGSTIDLSLVQHLDLDTNLLKNSDVTIGYISGGGSLVPHVIADASKMLDGDKNTVASTNAQIASWLKVYGGGNTQAFHIEISDVAIPVGGVELTMLDASNPDRCWMTDFEIQVTTDGENWTSVYSATDYDWTKTNAYTNVFAFNPVPATQIRILAHETEIASNNHYYLKIAEAAIYAPAEVSVNAEVTVDNGTGADKLTDGKLDAYYESESYTNSVDVDAPIVIKLAKTESIGAVRVYPNFVDGKPVNFMKAAQVYVSNDGETWESVMELTLIADPMNGAQLLLFPQGKLAQYVKIVPMQLVGDGKQFSLQLREVDIVGTQVPVDPNAGGPTQKLEKTYTNVDIGTTAVVLGYYDNPEMTGDIIDYQAAKGEAECWRDGDFNSRGLTDYFKFSELVQFGGQYVPAWHMTLGGSGAEFGCIELSVSKHMSGLPLSFKIQVKTPTSNGEWITIVEREDETWNLQHMTNKYEFEAVTATELRIVATKVGAMEDYSASLEEIAKNPANHRTRFEACEIDLFKVTEQWVDVEESAPESDTIVYDKVALTGDDVLGFGYYSGFDLENLVGYAGSSPTFAIDGNYGTRAETKGQQFQWLQDNNGGNAPALVLNLTKDGKPSTINVIEIAAREDGYCAPYHFVLQITTEADSDKWITVAEEETADWSKQNIKTFRFDTVEAYKMRLVCFDLTPAANIPREECVGQTTTFLHLNEVSLYNIYDPGNPYAENTCTQGGSASETVNHKVHTITAKNDNPENKHNANKAIDGLVTPENNNGWLVPKYYGLGDLTVGSPETIEIHTLYLWYHAIRHVDSASGDGTELYSESTGGYMPTWAANSYAFIDTAGEWYIDRDAKKIYYKADGTMDDKVAILPVTEQIINMKDCENVTFEGITFEHTSWTHPSVAMYLDQQANTYYENQKWVQAPAGILLLRCANIAFDKCEIRNMGTAGIKFKSDGDGTTTGCSVTNSLIHDISFSGIIVGEVYGHHGYQTHMLVKDTVIRNNYITRVGLDMFDSPAIIACYTNGTIIDHNEIAYCPYSGISTGWGWDQDGDAAHEELGNLQVTNNLVHDTGKTNRDGGSIYNLGPSKGSKMHGNYIYNSWDGSKTFENGLYLDQGSAYWEVYNNVIGSNVGYWMHMWMTTIHDNHWHDNFYVEGTKGRNDGRNNTVENNTAVPNGEFDSYEKAVEIMENAGLLDESVKRGIKEGFAPQHDITQDFMRGNEARYIEGDWGWNNVAASGQVSKTNYDSIKKEISIVVTPTTDVTAITLTFELEDGWTCDKKSGNTFDFTNPIEFTLTNGGQKIVWKVSVKNKIVSGDNIQGQVVDMGSILVNSDDADWSVKPAKRIGDTAFFNDYSGYLGQTFDVDTIFTFDMSSFMDETHKDWVAISLRNQDPYTSCLNGNTEYNISFNYHTIEVQKFDSGKRTVLYGNQTGFTSIYGELPNNFFYSNTRHSIKIGAVDVEDGVRLFMYVDNNLVFDIVDSDDPIRTGGYFAIYPETQMISLHAYTNQDTSPDTSALDEALAIVEGLVASDYTEESYAAVMSAMTQAQTILATAGGVTQEMVDEACNLLTAALAALVQNNGSTGPIIKPTEPDPTEPTEPKPTDPNGSGKTGDETLVISFIVLMLLSVAGIVAVVSLKRRTAR